MSIFLVKPLPKTLSEDIRIAFENLQAEIDAIEASQNLADIVADLTSLNNLDVTDLEDGAKVEVLIDSDHNNVSTIYNLVKSGGSHSWEYVGVYGVDTYNKTQIDQLLALKQNLIDSLHKLSSDLVDDTNSINKFVTELEKQQITLNKNAIMGIKNGNSISNFRSVEEALAFKQNLINNLNKLSADLVDDTNTIHKFVTALEKTQITKNKEDIEILRAEIDELRNDREVYDIVATYADLMAYDTSSLDPNDIIKVLVDESHNDAQTYYRWTGSSWSYIGGVGPYYTEAEVNNLLEGKQDTLTDSTSIDLTSNVVSVKQSYIDSQFATTEELNEIIEEVYGSEYTI